MSKVLDLEFYKQFYKHYFSEYNDTQIKNHWESQGESTSCIPNKSYLLDVSNFDWYFYKENNSDIPILKNKNEYFEHWLTKGIYQNRIYYFDYDYYRDLYDDLKNQNLSDEGLLAHWYLIGKKEGRICCKQDWFKITEIDKEIKTKNLKNLIERKDELDNLMIENDISRNKLEVEFSMLLSKFLSNEEQKISRQEELLRQCFDNYIMSFQERNMEAKRSLEYKKENQIEKSNETLEKHNQHLSLQIDKNNKQLELKIFSITNKKINILEEELLMNKRKIENERINFEENLDKKRIILKEQELSKKRDLLVDLELRKRTLICENEIMELIAKSNSSKESSNLYSEAEKESFRIKMKKSLDDSIENELFSDNQKGIKILDNKIKRKIKETNEAKIMNKKKIFQENILDVGLRIVEENKLGLSQIINKKKLDVQNEFNDISQNQLKNKEVFIEQFLDFKSHQSKMIENSKSFYEEIKNQKKVIFEKYENDVIANKQLQLDIELEENKKRLRQYKKLDNEILEEDRLREKKMKEVQDFILDEQNKRNKNLHEEIMELQMNVEKNELLVKNQELEIKEKINKIEINRLAFEEESEKMKLKLVEEKNKKINSYLSDTLDYRKKIMDKRNKIKSLMVTEMNKKNEMEVKNNTLIVQKRKNLEETIENQYLQLEKINKTLETEQKNKEKLFKQELDKDVISEINSLNEKQKIEKITLDIINKMEKFQKVKMKEFDDIHSKKLLEFETAWKNFCITFKKNSDKHLEKIFINHGDFNEQFNLYLKYYSKEIEKELLEIEDSIQERNVILIEKRNKYNKQSQQESLDESNILENKKKIFQEKLESLKSESEMISLEQVNQEKKKYIIDKELEVRNLEKKIHDKEEICSKFLDNAQLEFQNKINSIVSESENKETNKELRLSLEMFYKNFVLSKDNFQRTLNKRVSIKFYIENLQQDIDTGNGNLYLNEYEEQNKLVQEYNQLFRVNKKNIQNKINSLLNEISQNEKLNYKTIIEKGRFNKFNIIKNSLESMYYTYPNLFHKHLLNSSESHIHYEIKKYSKNRKKYIAHLHCFNIDNFDNIYGKYINIIKKYFYIIITFSYGNPESLFNQDISILKIKNKGMDIGGKIVCLHFLKVNDVKYDIIFFAHSKTNVKKRNEYFNPFLRNEVSLSNIITTLKNNRKTGAVFPNCIHSQGKNPNEYKVLQKNNNLYLNELFKLLEIKKENPIIFEGNVFMIKKEVLSPLIHNLELVYSLLNDENSFDFNWFKIYNNLGDNVSLKEAYTFFANGKGKKKVGNNIPLMLQTHSSSLPDGMIEHAIERIWDGLLMSCNKNYIVI